jgi:hypothetical protein
MLKRLAILCGLPLVFSTNAFALNLNDLVRGAIQEGMRRAVLSEWRRLPASEIACIDQNLRQQGLSVDAIGSWGIEPSDPRLAQLRASCRNQFVQTPPQFGSTPYVVDGLALGDQVQFGSQAYQRYRCGPSDKFLGFVWCHEEHTTKEKGKEITRSHSILHAQDGTAWYVNSYIEPAFFGHNDIQNEIKRLSSKFSQQPRIIRLPQRAGLPNAVIAIWGKILLEPLNASDVSTVASGGSVDGLSVSFLGDLQRSAKAGVPVYRLSGGAGFLWVATYKQNGQGVLRFLTIDTSKITPSVVVTKNPSGAEPSAGNKTAPTASPTPQGPAGNTAQTALAKIHEISEIIEQKLPSIRSTELHAQGDEVLAKSATANEDMSFEDLNSLVQIGEQFVARLHEIDEFNRVSSIATERLEHIKDEIKTVVTDAPYLKEINKAIEDLQKTQETGSLRSLQTALANLNDVFRRYEPQIRRDQFYSP